MSVIEKGIRTLKWLQAFQAPKIEGILTLKDDKETFSNNVDIFSVICDKNLALFYVNVLFLRKVETFFIPEVISSESAIKLKHPEVLKNPVFDKFNAFVGFIVWFW